MDYPPGQSNAKYWTLVTYQPPNCISKIIEHSDRDLLITFHTPPELHRLDTNTFARQNDPRNSAAWQCLHRFEGVKACHGMARLDKWRYMVITSDDEITDRKDLILKPGSGKLWIVDLQRWETGNGWVEVKKVVDASTSGCLRHIIPFPSFALAGPSVDDYDSGTWPDILISDSTAGRILLLNPNTLEGRIWFAHPSMKPVQKNTSRHSPITKWPLGITGLQICQNYLYFLNASAGTLHRVELHPTSFRPITGSLQCISNYHAHLSIARPHFPACLDLSVTTYGNNRHRIRAASPDWGIIAIEETTYLKKWRWTRTDNGGLGLAGLEATSLDMNDDIFMGLGGQALSKKKRHKQGAKVIQAKNLTYSITCRLIKNKFWFVRKHVCGDSGRRGPNGFYYGGGDCGGGSGC